MTVQQRRALQRVQAAPVRDAAHEHDHVESDEHQHGHGEHGHSHGLVDRSILRSRAGLKAVAASLLILGLTAGVQAAIFAFSNSVALLADLIHTPATH